MCKFGNKSEHQNTRWKRDCTLVVKRDMIVITDNAGTYDVGTDIGIAWGSPSYEVLGPGIA